MTRNSFLFRFKPKSWIESTVSDADDPFSVARSNARLVLVFCAAISLINTAFSLSSSSCNLSLLSACCVDLTREFLNKETFLGKSVSRRFVQTRDLAIGLRSKFPFRKRSLPFLRHLENFWPVTESVFIKEEEDRNPQTHLDLSHPNLFPFQIHYHTDPPKFRKN